MSKKTVLVSPDGREYSSSDKAEITRLKARGYKAKPVEQAAQKSATNNPVVKK